MDHAQCQAPVALLITIFISWSQNEKSGLQMWIRRHEYSLRECNHSRGGQNEKRKGPRREPWSTSSGGKKEGKYLKKTEGKVMREVETKQISGKQNEF